MLAVTVMVAMPAVAQDAEEARKEMITQYSLGYEYFKNKDYQTALPFLRQVAELRILPGVDDAGTYKGIYKQLATCYTELGMPDSALVAWKWRVEAQPDDAYAHKMILYYYESVLRDEESTRAKLREMYDMTEEIEYLTRLKDHFLANQEYEEAIALYDELIEQEPDNAGFKHDRLNLIRQSGDPDEVKADLQKLHESNPANTTYILELLRFAKEENNEEEMVLYIDKLLEINPEDTDALNEKALVLDNQLKYREEIGVLQQLAKLKPDDAEVHCRIAVCYIELQQWSAARAAANRALKIRPGYGLAYIRIGEAYDRCAEACVRKKGGAGKRDFNDKLVSKLAYDTYARARQDAEWAAQAERGMNSLQNVIPTKEDYFMNKGKEKATGAAYAWIY